MSSDVHDLGHLVGEALIAANKPHSIILGRIIAAQSEEELEEVLRSFTDAEMIIAAMFAHDTGQMFLNLAAIMLQEVKQRSFMQ